MRLSEQEISYRQEEPGWVLGRQLHPHQVAALHDWITIHVTRFSSFVYTQRTEERRNAERCPHTAGPGREEGKRFLGRRATSRGGVIGKMLEPVRLLSPSIAIPCGAKKLKMVENQILAWGY